MGRATTHPWLARIARRARLASFAATAGLLLGLAGLAATAGYLLAGLVGVVVSLGVAAGLSWAAARYSNAFLLRAYGARPLARWEAPWLFELLEALAARADIPPPGLWLVPTDQPNAMAMGRSPEDASVAVTSGLLARLNARGVAGVLAHELAHIRHRDILLSSFAATITSLLASVGRLLIPGVLLALPFFIAWAPQILAGTVLLLVAPVVAVLLQAALSRQREFAADAEGAELTGDPLGLAAALQVIESSGRSWLEILFGRRRERERDPLLHSHPATEARVARLVALARGVLARSQRPARPGLRFDAHGSSWA